ncbi:MAG: N-acetylneuraminate synthase family protein, partial [Nitrospinota bacterium]
MKEVAIGPYKAGHDNPPIVVAEIGINHNGSLELAKEMIEKAAENGADLIKLQSIQPEKFMAADVPYYGIIESLSFSFKEQEELFAFAKKKNALLFSAPFDTETADFLEKMDVPAFKIA